MREQEGAWLWLNALGTYLEEGRSQFWFLLKTLHENLILKSYWSSEMCVCSSHHPTDWGAHERQTFPALIWILQPLTNYIKEGNCYHLKMFGVLRNNSSAKYRRNCPSVSPNQFLNTLYRIMESQSIKCWRDLKDHWVPNTTSMGSDTSL